MYSKPIGVSILTNGNRLESLKLCLSSFLEHCSYRPLIVGILDNGSTDSTGLWLSGKLPKIDGVEFRFGSEGDDRGCAQGTNGAIEMVSDCEYVLHLESDFECLKVTPNWLQQAVEFMEEQKCDYLYLRRMVNEIEMQRHWWSQWMPKVDLECGPYLRVPGFWWSNNPHIHRTKSMFEQGVLPLNYRIDGFKGDRNWSRPELETKKPQNAWIHKWGFFVHELASHGDLSTLKGCMDIYGCKYGYFKDGKDAFCRACRKDLDYSDMPYHEKRFVNGSLRIKAVIMSHNDPANTEVLFRALKDVFDDVEIFDNGSDVDKVPEHVSRKRENVYWTGTWNEILETCKEYDAVWVVGCDLKLLSDPMLYRQSIESSLPFGCWSPCIQGRSLPFMQEVFYKGESRRVRNVEGQGMAASKQLMEQVDRLVDGSDIGFGQDLWLCSEARRLGLKNVIDGRVTVYHPEGIGYDVKRAVEQMETAFSKRFGSEFRQTVFGFGEGRYPTAVGPSTPYPIAHCVAVFEDNLMGNREKSMDEKALVVVTVNNGWGMEEFIRATAGLPQGTRRLVMRKGVVGSVSVPGIETVPYDPSLSLFLKEADIAFFSRVGSSNEADYTLLLKAGVPMIVRKSHSKDLVEHEVDGWLFEDENWGKHWIDTLAKNPELRKKIERVRGRGEVKKEEVKAENKPEVIVPVVQESKEIIVTVITPTYQRDPAVLKRCFGSMILQTMPQWEQLVCSDGGEEPHVRRAIDLANDSRIAYHHLNSKKEGDFGNTARVEMIKKSKGKFIMFCDDDNIILPNYMDEMVTKLENAPDCGFAVCRVMHFGPLNEAEVGRPPKVLNGEPVKLYHIDPLQVLVRTEAMQKVGWDTVRGYLSDGVTLERLGAQYKHVSVDKVLGIHM